MRESRSKVRTLRLDAECERLLTTLAREYEGNASLAMRDLIRREGKRMLGERTADRQKLGRRS